MKTSMMKLFFRELLPFCIGVLITVLLLFCGFASLFGQGSTGTAGHITGEGYALMEDPIPQTKRAQLALISADTPLVSQVKSEQSAAILYASGTIALNSNPFQYPVLKVWDDRVYARDADYSPLFSFYYNVFPSQASQVIIGKIGDLVYFRSDGSIHMLGGIRILNRFLFANGTGANAGKLVVIDSQTGQQHPLW